MVDIVPIKVKIGLRVNGHADYPDWTSLTIAGKGTTHERETEVVNNTVGSWLYDKTSGHQEDTMDSPTGMQWGMRLVSKQMALEAKAMWPDLITFMTESECQAFYDDRVTKHINDVNIDHDQLAGLKAECELIEKLIIEFPAETKWTTLKAICLNNMKLVLDENNTLSGVRKNKEKKWVDFKSLRKVNVIAAQ